MTPRQDISTKKCEVILAGTDHDLLISIQVRVILVEVLLVLVTLVICSYKKTIVVCCYKNADVDPKIVLKFVLNPNQIVLKGASRITDLQQPQGEPSINLEHWSWKPEVPNSPLLKTLIAIII